MTGANSSQRAMAVQHTLHQDLDPAAGISHAIQARLDDAGIVKDNHVAGTQIRWKVGKHPVLQCAACGVEMQHAAIAPLLGRKLRNESRRKVEVEILSFHGAYYTAAGIALRVAANRVFSDNAPPVKNRKSFAGMAELVDARDSKSRDREVMGVRFPLPAPTSSPMKSKVVRIFI